MKKHLLLLIHVCVFRYQTYFDEVKQLYYRVSGKNMFCSIAIVLSYQLMAVVLLYTVSQQSNIIVEHLVCQTWATSG